MKVHIVGGGPTGISIAWELLKYTDHEVHLYEKKDMLGGSWHEPTTRKRDFHAPRMLFKNAFVNTVSLFNEMRMDWNDFFIKRNSSELYVFLLKSFSIQDYLALTSLTLRVMLDPNEYKRKSLRESISGLSPQGQKILENVTYTIDGVGWDVMTAYEFVESFNQVGLSSQWEQKISGRMMGFAMQKALVDAGVRLHLNTELTTLTYLPDGFEAVFSNEMIATDDLLILCVDNYPASKMVGSNWGPLAKENILFSSYTCLHVMLDYDREIKIHQELETAINTRWNILASVLPDGKTISCVMCNLTDEILTSPPEKIHKEVIEQLGLPEPVSSRVATGNEWQNGRWTFSQSSGVLNKNGQIPFFGANPKVALCGMMSPRNTPYASIEAAIEVGRTFCHEQFKTREALVPFKVSHLFILIVLIIILIYEIRRRNI